MSASEILRPHLWEECARHTSSTTVEVLDAWAAEQTTVQTFFANRANLFLPNILDQ